MRDLEGIRNAHFDQRLRSHALDLLIELKRCSEALPEDSPRGVSAKALVDKVWGDMPQDTTDLANPAPPPLYQPQGRYIPLSQVAGQGEVCVPGNTGGRWLGLDLAQSAPLFDPVGDAPIEAADPRE